MMQAAIDLFAFTVITIVFISAFSVIFFIVAGGPNGKDNHVSIIPALTTLVTQDWGEFVPSPSRSKLFWFSFIFAIVLGIFLLNMLIVVMSNGFNDVMASSAKAFWATRLDALKEITQIHSLLCKRPKDIHSLLCKKPKAVKVEVVEPEINKIRSRVRFSKYNKYWLHNCPQKDKKEFFNWWYHPWEHRTPSIKTRITYFYSYASYTDILISGILGNVLAGLKYDKKAPPKLVVPLALLSCVHFVIWLVIFLLHFILGLCTVGMLWPESWREFIFSGPIKSTRMVRIHQKKENSLNQDVYGEQATNMEHLKNKVEHNENNVEQLKNNVEHIKEQLATLIETLHERKVKAT